MLVSAKNVKSSETLATRMQGSQIARYSDDGKDVNTFFWALKLGHNDKFETLYGRKMSALKQYIDVFNHRTGNKVTLIETLKSNYGERELAGMLYEANHAGLKPGKILDEMVNLKNEQFRQWKEIGVIPKDALSVMFRLNDGDKTYELDRAVVNSYARVLH
ncbi:unnamed protein product [Phytophthora lilii]|uniref:Unnamed protein product n=1 Tax=Phytophthora lilii TaxID=2077276 RepID=A0A9W6X3U1_9STRA|nr:unnamed protein product [Phytophthora lilii]